MKNVLALITIATLLFPSVSSAADTSQAQLSPMKHLAAIMHKAAKPAPMSLRHDGKEVARSCLYLRCVNDADCNVGCDDPDFLVCDCSTTECQCR